MRTTRYQLAALLCFAAALAGADEDARVLYLANQGVLVERGETKILFDSLFHNGFGQYELVPEDVVERLHQGAPPFGGIDAVFVSHAHGDHFSADRMASYLQAQPDVRLYAPAQAVVELRRTGADEGVLARTVSIALDVGDAAARFSIDGIDIQAVRVPHSGWPTRMTDIENLVFHVRLDGDTTVMHFGDADAKVAHFAPHQAVWREHGPELALPPYWFFLSDDGRRILDEHIRPQLAIGTHVPTDVSDDPEERPAELAGYDLFTEPGQTRDLP